MLELGLKTLLSYLMGSLNGSLLLGKLTGGPDVRSFGSGNAGGTNALRARGKWFALGVVIIDVGKGFLSVWLLPSLSMPGVASYDSVSGIWLALACAGAAIIGHCYPVWFGFAGGKGGATAIGALLALSPELLVPALLVWLLVATTTGFVGLSTMIAAAALPVCLIITGLDGRSELFFFLLLLAVFILYTHRSNIQRMLRSEENRMDGMMVLRRPR